MPSPQRLVLLGLALFAPLITGSMLAYPGGTWFDRSATGYSPWLNFWCDLLRSPALNGQENELGRTLALAGFVAMAVAVIGFFWTAPNEFPTDSRATGWCKALGTAGVVGMIAVALLPSDRFPLLHSVAVSVSGPLGLTAGGVVIAETWQNPKVSRLVPGLGALTFLLTLLTLSQYVRQWLLGAPPSPLLPACQKLATACLIGWISITAYRVGRRGSNRVGTE